MELLYLVLLVIALVCFVLSAFGRVHSRVDLVALGLVFTILVFLLKAFVSIG